MSLRNQPYFPLYIQDYLTDEKLNECSASSQGIYVKILCIMHKSSEYGKILLKQKDKQSDNQILNFAYKLVKHLTFSESEISIALEELISEKVIFIEGDKLCQKRMIRDNDLSIKRSKAGKKGGKSTQKNKNFAKAKVEANSEYEYENENEVIYPYNSVNFKKAWKAWLIYKNKEFKFKYKSKDTEQIALKKLSELSKDENEAILIIQESIANGWKGFFELNKSKDGRTKQTKAHSRLTDEQLEYLANNSNI